MIFAHSVFIHVHSIFIHAHFISLHKHSIKLKLVTDTQLIRNIFIYMSISSKIKYLWINCYFQAKIIYCITYATFNILSDIQSIYLSFFYLSISLLSMNFMLLSIKKFYTSSEKLVLAVNNHVNSQNYVIVTSHFKKWTDNLLCKIWLVMSLHRANHISVF